MLGLGITELIIIAGIALIVIGPEKFPEFAKIVTHTIRDIRGYVEDVQKDLSKELKPVRKEVNKLSRYSAEDYIDALSRNDDSSEDKSTQSKDKVEQSDGSQEMETKSKAKRSTAGRKGKSGAGKKSAGATTGEETGPNQPEEASGAATDEAQQSETGAASKDAKPSPGQEKTVDAPAEHKQAREPVAKRPDVKQAPYKQDKDHNPPKFYKPSVADHSDD